MNGKRNKYDDTVEELRKQGYSEKVINNWLNPKNLGIKNSKLCDGYSGWNSCPRGDSMAICLKIDGDLIREATFLSDVCIGSISAASVLTEKVKNLTLAEATKISSEEIIDDLGGLPEQFIHCAGLARDTLTKAILNYHQMGFKEAPWKKMYRRKS
ncbi:MAG: iron-sulfur cluster assembly scaffold protein [Candidatus Aminicenantes bacterium]|nr:iron-sulfur cluster assembly scaffold protein [Candidatus Aminicenantes bacterium]NQT56251.1 iron-sulfur cluster assembly scaffold protein [Desulfobacteraceae bacterium]